MSEYLDSTLEDMIPRNGRGLDEPQASRVASQVLQAIKYLHDNEVEA